MKLKPWYKVIFPREDLRECRPLDASEFAVHLDKVRDGTAPEDYRDPTRFFERTYLTGNLQNLASEVLRRMSGIKTETSAVFNMTTQFGGGKTHALTLLYHLAAGGQKAEKWQGVDRLMDKAGVDKVPGTAVATFVGTEFDSITGRGGSDGTPLRKTPWGEIAWQLGGEAAFAVVAKHEKQFVEPKGDVIRAFLPKDKPCLILMDEIVSYVSTYRKVGYHNCLYNFIQSLSETARGQDNIVLVVSVPSSVISYTDADEADQQRFKHMLDRLGKAVIMAAETETSEIIRRRLFDWGGLPAEAGKVASEYAGWITEHRDMVPRWFPVDNAREEFEASYPFHPMALSVFARKWQSLPRFQQTRGVLRMLALWVARTYQDGYKGAHKDPLIGLGTAPLEDPLFRTAVLEQLGEPRLEGAVTTDICGDKGSHATRLDAESVETIKKARLHRKVATAVFFESNGGQAKEGEATISEIRLTVAEPDVDVGNIETALEALSETCYYLRVERNRYRFGLSPNLNKLLADRRANISDERIEDRIRAEILKVFEKQPGIEVVPFADKSNQVTDRPVVTLVVLSPQHSMMESSTLPMVDSMIREYGSSGRTFKSALLFAVPDNDTPLREEARKLLAWQDIKDEEEDRLDDSQRTQLSENLKKSQRDLKETVWRTYKNVALLGKDNKIRTVDLGLVHSSQAPNMVKMIVDRLRQDGDIETRISPNFLVRNWPPAFTEWSTKSVRDAFFASPQFPRLLNGDAVRDTVARGVSGGMLAYVGKSGDSYNPFLFEASIGADEVEISEDMFIIKADEAKKHIEPPNLSYLSIRPERSSVKPNGHITFQVQGLDQHGRAIEVREVSWSAKGGDIDDKGGFKAGADEGEYLVEAAVGDLHAQTTVLISKEDTPPPPPPQEPKEEVKGFQWSGDVPAQKWMIFYTKVLAKYATTGNLKLTVNVEVHPDEGLAPHRIEETKAVLRELGLDANVRPVTR